MAFPLDPVGKLPSTKKQMTFVFKIGFGWLTLTFQTHCDNTFTLLEAPSNQHSCRAIWGNLTSLCTRQHAIYKLTSNLKELVKLDEISSFKRLSFDNEPVLSRKPLINSYIVCKILNFQSIIAQRISGIIRVYHIMQCTFNIRHLIIDWRIKKR